MSSFKLCIMVSLMELNIFITVSGTLTRFQGHIDAGKAKLQFVFSHEELIQLSLGFV